MNHLSRHTAIRIAIKKGGAGKPQVEALETEVVEGDARPARHLRAYASPEGAAWFESVMAEFDTSGGAARRSGRTTS